MTSPTSATAERDPAPQLRWRWPPDRRRYDCSPLTDVERAAIATLGPRLKRWQRPRRKGEEWSAIERLLKPLRDAHATLYLPDHTARWSALLAVANLLHHCLEQGTTFWEWDYATWVHVCDTGRGWRERRPQWAYQGSRHHVMALAYLLGDFTEPLPGAMFRTILAEKMFGPDAVRAALDSVIGAVNGWGYGTTASWQLPNLTCEALIVRRSPDLADLSAEFIDRLRTAPGLSRARRSLFYRLRLALVTLGLIPPTVWRDAPPVADGSGVGAEWKEWIDRWYMTSTLTLSTRRANRCLLFRLGRWLAEHHPDVDSPRHWTRQHCAAFVAHAADMRYGDYTANRNSLIASRIGQPLAPNAKAGYLYAVRQFFRDCQEWGWLPRRFDPGRALRTPPTLKALIGPDPRVIDDKLWAKLIWAGLNVTIEDFPKGLSGAFYPIEMLRALTLTWLFAGLRSDEIARLRVGCIRWQPSTSDDPEGSSADPICLLDIPSNKTGTAFTKPVEPLVGRAIAAWEAIRPQQPKLRDRKTGTLVDLLFCFRARRISGSYINDAIIPALCHKAGIPMADARGRITSHRARSTIATQLYNAKDPMTLFELQAWLGHRSPTSTQHYAKITPTTLTRAYRDAGYFARNVRVIEVLVDRDAVESGAAGAGEPWQHFDLGHGYCTYDFFERCPHRMACARCEFYVPKASARAQLLAAKQNLQRMLLEIPLTDDERAAVEGDDEAVGRLLARLADVATPTGATPRVLNASRPLVMLPMTDGSQSASSAAPAGEEHPAPSIPGTVPPSEPR
ncbi:MAG TPA: tyrosine-type recombinase/integrase [Solirubrobacteraceae bacterium]|nr:tyrosine-type recombinase/integrase [Solirubrobacteraceae bacterium]